jgi:hypothetical protein
MCATEQTALGFGANLLFDTTFDEGKWVNDPRLMKEDGCHG